MKIKVIMACVFCLGLLAWVVAPAAASPQGGEPEKPVFGSGLLLEAPRLRGSHQVQLVGASDPVGGMMFLTDVATPGGYFINSALTGPGYAAPVGPAGGGQYSFAFDTGLTVPATFDFAEGRWEPSSGAHLIPLPAASIQEGPKISYYPLINEDDVQTGVRFRYEYADECTGFTTIIQFVTVTVSVDFIDDQGVTFTDTVLPGFEIDVTGNGGLNGGGAPGAGTVQADGSHTYVDSGTPGVADYADSGGAGYEDVGERSMSDQPGPGGPNYGPGLAGFIELFPSIDTVLAFNLRMDFTVYFMKVNTVEAIWRWSFSQDFCACSVPPFSPSPPVVLNGGPESGGTMDPAHEAALNDYQAGGFSGAPLQ